MTAWIIVSVPAFAVVFYLFHRYLSSLNRKKRRAEIMSRPIPQKWEDYLKKDFELYNHLPKSLQEKLNGYVAVFIDEKEFIGCAGLEVTESMKVIIAAQAMLLVLGQKKCHFYPKLWRIELYPTAYKAMAHDGMTVEESVRLGESWLGGRMVLSWNHSKQGAYKWQDGQSVVLHEFAHQLDQIDGNADGVPTLDNGYAYSSWADVMGGEYRKMLKEIEKHHKTLLDEYGATNPAEFFAVATETFFEKSAQMKKKIPETYQILKDFYKLDPASWMEK